MRREHAELGHHIGELRMLLRAARVDWSQLDHVLVALRANVVRHFAVEETDGYLNDVPPRSPKIEQEIRALREEHGQMRTDLAEIRQSCERRDLAQLRERLEAWLTRIAIHEERENALALLILDDGAIGGTGD